MYCSQWQINSPFALNYAQTTGEVTYKYALECRREFSAANYAFGTFDYVFVKFPVVSFIQNDPSWNTRLIILRLVMKTAFLFDCRHAKVPHYTRLVAQ